MYRRLGTVVLALASGCSITVSLDGLTGGAIAVATDAGAEAMAVTETSVGCVATQDTQDDPKNCGACGHDCLGGACTMGVCAPYLLVAGEAASPLSSLAVDATTVYWSIVVKAGSGVFAVGKTGGKSSAVTTRAVVSSLAADADALYIADPRGASVVRCPHGDCGASTNVAGGVDGASNLVLHGDNVFFTTVAAVFRAPKVGAANGQATEVLAAGANDPALGLAVDDDAVYVSRADGTIARCPMAGCEAGALILTSRPGSLALAVGSTDLLWTATGAAGAILRLPNKQDAGDAQTLLADANGPASLLEDDQRIYWIDTTRSAGVMSCRRQGACIATVLAASDSDPPAALAQDAVALYWITMGGMVRSLAK